MSHEDYITTEEALIMLKLYDPARHKHKKPERLKWLVDRALLTRCVINKRVMLYSKKEVKELFRRQIVEGLSLREKPNKIAA